MKKQKFTAIFSGVCYLKAYGRKHYKHGISLRNVESNNCVIAEKMSVSKSKAFDVLDAVADSGKPITFDAVLNDDNTVNYISNVQVVE